MYFTAWVTACSSLQILLLCYCHIKTIQLLIFFAGVVLIHRHCSVDIMYGQLNTTGVEDICFAQVQIILTFLYCKMLFSLVEFTHFGGQRRSEVSMNFWGIFCFSDMSSIRKCWVSFMCP